jgi:hypothetical protein
MVRDYGLGFKGFQVEGVGTFGNETPPFIRSYVIIHQSALMSYVSTDLNEAQGLGFWDQRPSEMKCGLYG